MRVLSLFDGMSCGRLALDKAGVKVKKYYASEIDKYAIQVATKNYPDTIQLGSVIDLKKKDLKKMKIDILIGGSPCQGFSVSGKMRGSSTKCGKDVTSLKQYKKLKKEGFEFDGQSYLFWEYVRVWKILKPKYFFLENVRVTKKWLPMFNEAMGVEPIMINSALVSAQNRVRYYWTNIPNVTQPEDRGIVLKDILETGDTSRPCTLREVKKDSNCIHIADADDINGHDILKRVYSDDGKSPTLNACTGGNREPKVLCGASRGRYIIDGKMKTAGLTEQMMAVRSDEKTNCLTTVQKDNYVVEGLEPGDRVPILEVPEATKKGYCEVEDGDCFDYAVPNPKTRRGRSMKDKSNALLTSNQFMRYEHPTYRKLTPLECERLQTVPDNYTDCVSNSQRYKMLGNGWTVDVIAHIFKGLK